MIDMVKIDRRSFLALGVLAVGGLTLGTRLGPAAARRTAAVFTPNAFVHLGSDDSVLILVGRSEMGQGVYTALPMLIAEELDADWSKVKVQAAPTAREYDNPNFGMQGTGGSSSVSSSWKPLREAGAAARAMLVTAAAELWRVDAGECRTEKGRVFHDRSGREVAYGSLVDRASRLPLPRAVTLKDPRKFTLIGQPLQRLDGLDKCNGKAMFGIDVTLPGMLMALIARAPMFGGKPKSFDSAAALAIPGVRHVVAVDAGVAVVADNFWAASRGRDALQVAWQDSALAGFDSEQLRRRYLELLQRPGAPAITRGDFEDAWSRAARTLDVQFEFPFLAHATMEPMNCVADVRADRCEVWVGTQFQTYDRDAAATAAGLRPEQVQLHTTLLGGGFGRRGICDGHFVREAVQVSRAVGAPVKVVWTRSDDLRGGYYRPAYHHRLSAALDGSGELLAWLHRVVGQSVLAGTPFGNYIVDGIDRSSVEEPYYQIPNLRTELHTTELGIPVWAWRSVGATHNGFAIECFIDELAQAAGADPYQYRRNLLQPRQRATLDLAAAKAGWGKPLPRGRGRGIGVFPFDSFVAQIAEVSVTASGDVKVERVVCAIDCGTVVNPDIVRAQLEGGIAMGLSAALHEQITFADGRVQQSGYDRYRILRMSEMPAVEVHFMPGDNAEPRGVGEAGVPPIAPAVANAIFAATGKRIRRLPIRSPVGV